MITSDIIYIYIYIITMYKGRQVAPNGALGVGTRGVGLRNDVRGALDSQRVRVG